LREISENPRTGETVPYPYWDEFLQSVQKLNEFVRLRCLRHYQASLLDETTFEIVSPFSASRIQPARSALLSARVGYLFLDSARFWLLTGPLRQGHPLASFCSELDDRIETLFPSARSQIGFIRKHLPIMREFQTPPKLRSGVELVIGHMNFAHHLWNELPALDEWLSRATDRAISETMLHPTAEPFGSLKQIFPRLELAKSLQGTGDRSPDASRLSVRPGSSQISVRVRQAVNAYCSARADQSALKPVLSRLHSNWPRVWISVRTESRTADNQLEYLVELLREIFLAYPDTVCILDGFSFPISFFEDDRMTRYRAEFSERAALTAEFISELQNCTAAVLGTRTASQLCSISGLSLAEAATVGSFCDYYVCHAGTLQHKVAWLHNISGFIHLPPMGNEPAQARWYAEQLEEGIAPDILPDRYNTATGTSPHMRAAKREARRNANYHIADVKGAVQFTMQCMKDRLGKRPPTLPAHHTDTLD